MIDFLIIDDSTEESILASFKNIANEIMNQYLLCIGAAYYRIVECEFYYNSTAHEDPFVHGHALQKSTIGQWYFHGSGLDITLGNGKGYGGILIRGIAEVNELLPMPDRASTVIGPLNVCNKIFNTIGSVMLQPNVAFGFVHKNEISSKLNLPTATVFAVTRIGLNHERDALGQFHSKPYRFITFLHLQHKEAEKVKNYLINKAPQPITKEAYKAYQSGEKY